MRVKEGVVAAEGLLLFLFLFLLEQGHACMAEDKGALALIHRDFGVLVRVVCV